MEQSTLRLPPIISTLRLTLVPINVELHAEDMYEYAQDPQVGPRAGWPVHQSIEDTRHVINSFLSAPHQEKRYSTQKYYNSVLTNENCPIFAIILKEALSEGEDSEKTAKNAENCQEICGSDESLIKTKKKQPIRDKMIGTIALKDLFTAQDSIDWSLIDPAISASISRQQHEQNRSNLPADFVETFDINVVELGYCISPKYWGKGYCLEAAYGLLLYTQQHLNDPIVIITPATVNAQSNRVCQKLCGTTEPVVSYEKAMTLFDGTMFDLNVYKIPHD